MTKIYQPHRRRILAGLAVVGLMPVGGAITAGAQESLPNCERSELSGKRSEYLVKIEDKDGAADPFARVDIKPAKIKQKTIRFAPDITEDNLVLFIPKILASAAQTNKSYHWSQMSTSLPTMYFASNGEPVKVANVHITLGDKTTHKEKYTYAFQQIGVGRKLGGIKKQEQISITDEYKKTGWQKLATWLDQRKASGDVKFRISDQTNGPDGLVITYKRKDIVRAIKHAEAAMADLETELAAGKCALVAKSEGCFMTTAACDVIGLADDCWELETLRTFRDGWLSEQIGGTTDIVHYYNMAPDVIQHISNRQDASKVWLKLYWQYILPSAVLVKFGFNKSARNHYSAMMRKMDIA
jgi:hypothetical protein